MSRILIINQPLGNRGDEAAHRAFVHRLRDSFPDSEISVLMVAEKPESVEIFKDKSVNYIELQADRFFWKLTVGLLKKGVPLWLQKILWKLDGTACEILSLFQSADAVVVAPGGTCLGTMRSWPHLSMVYMALSCGKDLSYFARSIGPFHEGDRFSKLAIDCLKRMNFVSLRDPISMQIAKKYNIPAVKTLDSAFLEYPEAELPSLGSDSSFLAEPYCIYVPNSLSWNRSFRGTSAAAHNLFLLALNHILKSSSCRVVMLPQLTSPRGDKLFFEDLKADCAEPSRVFVAPETFSSDVQQSIIRGARFVVGARYHSVVFAINNEVPFIAFSYEHKIYGMLSELSYLDNCVELKDVGESELRAFKKRFAKIDAVRPDRKAAQKVAEEAYEIFLKHLRSCLQ